MVTGAPRSWRSVTLARPSSLPTVHVIAVYIGGLGHVYLASVIWIKIVLRVYSLCWSPHLVGYSHTILSTLSSLFLLFVDYHHRVSRFI